MTSGLLGLCGMQGVLPGQGFWENGCVLELEVWGIHKDGLVSRPCNLGQIFWEYDCVGGWRPGMLTSMGWFTGYSP